MAANDYVLVQGMRDTRGTLELWRRDPGPLLSKVFLGAFAIGCFLLTGVWIVASLSTPDPSIVDIPGIQHPVSGGDLAHTLYRNSLVLAFHATACVAGFIAGASMPLSAAQRTGFSKRLHEEAGRWAIFFVIGVTMFSLSTQIYILGNAGATLAQQSGISPGELVLTVAPHALIELTAVFLPLAAWIMFSRRGEWNRLLAATFVTVAIAIPMLVISAFLEAYLWPEVLKAVSPVFT
jgi:Stage II sporulation protein M